MIHIPPPKINVIFELSLPFLSLCFSLRQIYLWLIWNVCTEYWWCTQTQVCIKWWKEWNLMYFAHCRQQDKEFPSLLQLLAATQYNAYQHLLEYWQKVCVWGQILDRWTKAGRKMTTATVWFTEISWSQTQKPWSLVFILQTVQRRKSQDSCTLFY